MIRSAEELGALLPQLAHVERVAVDTEAAVRALAKP